MLGLEMLTARGVLAKVNSVMIPGINDEHLIEVNRAVKSRGAFLHNIMPLISEAEHGTVFGLTGQRGPTAQELKALQDACKGEMNMMRHCRQCRADAVGLLGEDRSAEFTIDKVMADGGRLRSRHAPGLPGQGRGRARGHRRGQAARTGDARRRDRRRSRSRSRSPPRAAADQRAFRPRPRIPDLRGLDRRRQVRRPSPRRPVLRGRLRATTASSRSSRRSTTATRCWSPRSASARRTRWPAPASRRSRPTRSSTSSSR